MSAHTQLRREVRLDLLRGYFFVGMTLEHLPTHPFSAFFRQTYGFVSVAEGFVFVSGVVFALVYGKVFLREGRGGLRRRAWSRARDIYLNHAGLYTMLLLAGALAGHEFRQNLLSAWWRGMLMLYQPGLFFLLPMYFRFVLAGAELLEVMLRGRGWLVMAGSVGVWVAAQFGLGVPPLAPAWFHPGPFNILGWQLLFFSGMYFGCRTLNGSPAARRSSWLLGLAAATAAGFLVLRHWRWLFGVGLGQWHETAITGWKYNCHAARMINFAACAYVLWHMANRIGERALRGVACRMLAFIGRHSLPVYGWSLLVTYAAIACEQRWATLTPEVRAALAVATALSLLIPAWVHQEVRRASAKGAAAIAGVEVASRLSRRGAEMSHASSA